MKMAENAFKTHEEMNAQRPRVLKMLDRATKHVDFLLNPRIGMTEKMEKTAASDESTHDYQLLTLFAVYLDQMKQSAPNQAIYNKVIDVLGEKIMSGSLFKEIMDKIRKTKKDT